MGPSESNLSLVSAHLQTILTFIIALIATWIAYQQHLTNRNKLKLDLFDRRLKVYHSVRDTVVIFSREASIDFDEFRQLRISLIGADFLFGEEVIEFNSQLTDWLLESMTIRDELNSDQLEPTQRTEKLDRKHEVTGLIVGSLDSAHEVYKPYFKLAHIR